jgi:sec-independent protein translocase protein TatB
MFDIGFSELVLIALLALILLGPKRLPEVARAAGKGLARIRHFVNSVKSDLDAEMRNAEIMELQKLKQELDETRRVIQESSGKVLEEITRTGSSPEPTIQPPAGAGAIEPPAEAPKPAAGAKARRRPKAKKKHGQSAKTRRR